MTKAEALEKLKAGEVTEEVISALESGDGGTEARLKALEAKLEAEAGKAAGILADKKKAQEKAEALQAKIEELEGKDLGEVERMKLEMERMQSRLEKAEADKTEIESTYQTEKRNASIQKIAGQFKWLDSVPESLRLQAVERELGDTDLGNEVLVADKVKTITEQYSGLLAADVPGGAGAKPGEATPAKSSAGLDALLAKSDSDIMADPKAFVAEAIAASENQ